MTAAEPVHAVIVSTGYSGPPSPHILVDPVDRTQPQDAMPPFVAGYRPRGDGHDSTPDGPGTLACLAAFTSLRGQTGVPFPWVVVSVKCGDGAPPLSGVQGKGLPAAVEGAVNTYHKGRGMVLFIDYDVTGSKEVAPLFPWLTGLGIPVVLPCALARLDLDVLVPPPPPGVLYVARDSPLSDYGAATVALAVAGLQPGPVALAWLAAARSRMPGVTAAAAAAAVCAAAASSPRWAGRCQTGGVLSGPVR